MKKKVSLLLAACLTITSLIGCGQPTGAVADPEATPAAEADVIVSEAVRS